MVDVNSPQYLQAQLAALMRPQNTLSMGGTVSAESYRRQQEDSLARNAAIHQLQQRLGGQGAGLASASSATNPNLQAILGATEGRATALEADPRTNAAMDFFQGVMGGQNAPYNDTVRSAMLTDASNRSAAAEGAQAGLLRDQMAQNGGSVTDPAGQAAMRELMSRRQGANQNAMNNIDQQANIANFNARMQGGAQLAGVRSAQNAQINQMGLAGAEHRGRIFEDTPTASSYVAPIFLGGTQAPPQQNNASTPRPIGQQTASPQAPRPQAGAAPHRIQTPQSNAFANASQNGRPIVTRPQPIANPMGNRVQQNPSTLPTWRPDSTFFSQRPSPQLPPMFGYRNS